MKKRDVRDAGIVVAARLAVGAATWAGGFRAVSDDDFARIVHAQEFALSPALDPTGTSWLPLPFWLNGTVMMATSTSITVARVMAWVLGIAASLLLLWSARILIDNKNGALLGAVVATVFPWSARLGVAAVPELPAAALAVFALATLSERGRRYRMLGAASVACACLCRYEPWLIAAAFCVYTLRDALASEVGATTRDLWRSLLIAASAPIAWIAHNALRHGDPLHFVARVSAYKIAVEGGAIGWLDMLGGYPLSLAREEPALFIVSVALLVVRGIPPSFRRAGVALGVMVACLSLASLRGGAPTHHVGRAVLMVWLVLALGVGEAVRATLVTHHRTWLALFVLAVVPLGALVLRPWYAQLDSFIHREHEVTIGRSLKPWLSEERALVEVRDYGFFAVQAGSGAPDRVIVDRSLDPRKSKRRSSFESVANIRDRARETQCDIVVGYRTAETEALGTPFATAGSWAAWRLTPAPAD